MTKGILHKLSSRKAITITAPGRHSDGGNLYLSISLNGARSWTFFYRAPNGKRREMGLGSAHPGGVTLAEARQLAANARALLARRLDPLEHKRGSYLAPVLADDPTTFLGFARQHIIRMSPSWKSPVHKKQWIRSVETHCTPIHAMRIADIDTEAVLKVLQPIWQTIPKSAAMTRGRIEAILDAAKAKGLRQGENPARWKGHLSHLLIRPKNGVIHHAALPWAEAPAFIRDLRKISSVDAKALAFVILTVARSGEALGATWGEIDFTVATWRVSPDRMKTGKEHRVPLSSRTLEILRALPKGPGDMPIFTRSGRPLGKSSMNKLLHAMGRSETVHGFRSTFRDWAVEGAPHFNSDAIERCLAHETGSTVQRAYKRTDHFEARIGIMQAWSDYLSAGENVVTLATRQKRKSPEGSYPR